jgi:hypothetical protein
MKKTMLAFLLIASIVMLSALESDPSDVVGFVKYECLTGNNLIALPMDAGYTMSNEVGNAITGANQIAYWDNTAQGWVTSNKGFGTTWSNAFAVTGGMPLMVRTTGDTEFYVAGNMFDPEPNYTLLVGNNTIMVPLSRTDLTMSNLVGNDISNANQMSYWDNVAQGWVTSNKGFGTTWSNAFATDIAMPLMTRVTAGSTWPAPPIMSSKPSITNQNNFRK